MKIFRKTDMINESVTLFDDEDRMLAEGSRKGGRLVMRCHEQDYYAEWQNPRNLFAAFPAEGTLFRAEGTVEYSVRLENTSISLRSVLTEESVNVTLFDREGIVCRPATVSAFAKDSFCNYLSVRASLTSLFRLLQGKAPLYCEGTYRGASRGILLGLVLLPLCYRPHQD